MALSTVSGKIVKNSDIHRQEHPPATFEGIRQKPNNDFLRNLQTIEK
jgi:hypothetical protein